MIRSPALLAAAILLAAGTPSVPAADETPSQRLSRVERQRMNDTTPADAYRYFSGNLPNAHNLPAIYASGYGASASLTVVGNGVELKFPMSQRDAAFRAYEDLLRATGYLPRR